MAEGWLTWCVQQRWEQEHCVSQVPLQIARIMAFASFDQMLKVELCGFATFNLQDDELEANIPIPSRKSDPNSPRIPLCAFVEPHLSPSLELLKRAFNAVDVQQRRVCHCLPVGADGTGSWWHAPIHT